ncbi:gamma-glutamylcyclotransferase [Zhengella sp. ZM62]|uniref:gamma-glutamylcyclotransferase n=1 Tax=Zhengella sedimenti TaxID=3390035 RepID=UPI00397507F4
MSTDADMGDFWVFGYGSLMWRPGFDHLESHRAHLYGFRRALCVRSFVHRGTEQRPGLVLGLDKGGSCVGVAFRVCATQRAPTIDYLRGRELVTHVYRERWLNIALDDGRRVKALGYVVDQHHHQYAGRLGIEEAARHVRGAHGQSGPNDEYVANTVEHLRHIGIRDRWLEAVAHHMRQG